MVRKALFGKIGYFNPKYVLEDYEFLVRTLSRGYNIAIIPEYFTLIYMNKNGLSGDKNKKAIQKSIFLMKIRYINHLYGFKNFIGLAKSLIGYVTLTLFFPIYVKLKRDVYPFLLNT